MQPNRTESSFYLEHLKPKVMKTLFVTILLCCCLSSFSQLVEIPDDNFVEWLNENFPNCMNGSMMDTTCEEITEYTYVNCQNKDIYDFTGLEHFTGLISLNINGNDASILPDLSGTTLNDIEAWQCNLTGIIQIPSSLTLLHVGNNELLEGISILPEGLVTLQIYGCSSLVGLPEIPSTLNWFHRSHTPQLDVDISNSNIETYIADNCEFTVIPDVPSTCTYLDLSWNPIGNQTFLPNQLEALKVSNAEMSELPNLPSTLINLLASNNSLSELPELPETLEQLFISENQITSLDLPQSITTLSAGQCNIESISGSLPNCVFFAVEDNNLTEIPELPNTVGIYAIANNPIFCLEEVPEIVSQLFNISGTGLTCLPNLPAGFDETDMEDLDSFPICQNGDEINNPNGCASGIGFEGFVYLDEDALCDFNETILANIPLKISQGGNELSVTSSLNNGRYLHSNELGNYEVELDFLNSPFVNNCGVNSVSLIPSQPYQTGVNFSIECEFDFDFGVQSILPSGWVFPGQIHTLSISAGEMSQFYNANCSESSAGEVIVSLEGPAAFDSTPVGFPEPSSLTDTSATFSIDDFTLLDLMDQFQISIQTETTATNVDEICITVQVNSEETDQNPENNSLTFCYPVVNSYDPNNKLVSPMNVEPGFDDWMYYTINFQNTGDAPAFEIRLEDELPSNLDLTSFQMTHTSHDSYFELVDQSLTVFYPNIMLADSTSNEPESKGFFQFKVKPLTAMTEGETIENSVSIFFDFNDPVITNTAITEAQTPNGILEQTMKTVTIFPNPSSGAIQITADNEIFSIGCFDLLGKEIIPEMILKKNSAILLFDSAMKGIYIISLETSRGVSRKRIILE